VIEYAESLPCIGIDVENPDFLPGTDAPARLSDFIGNAEFTGREHHNTPSVWRPWRAVPLRALFADSADKRIDDIADLLSACDTEFVQWQ
jgi:hypothetical protein